MADARGEDRSNYQGISSWSGDDFAIMKATESTTFQDRTFAQNWANAEAEGKPRSAYHFFHPAVSAAAQADYFVSFVRAHGLREGDGFVVDAETTVSAGIEVVSGVRAAARQHVAPQVVQAGGPDCKHDPLPTHVYGALGWCMHCQQYCGGTSTESGHPVQCAGCAAARAAAAVLTLDSAVQAFMDEVARLAGPHCPLLTYTDQALVTQFSSAYAQKYPDLWIAAPGNMSPVTGPWHGWKFLQTAFGGAPGGGDVDIYNGDAAQLDAWVNSYKQASPPPPPPVHNPPPPPAGLPEWQQDIIAKLPELSVGAADTGGHVDWVRQAQFLLSVVGVDPVVADGSFGALTLASVEATQQSRHLEPVDGVIGPETWQVLIAAQPGTVLPARVGEGATDRPGEVYWVHRIQVYCNTHGVPVSIDGIYGQGTDTAVKAVQRAYGIPETGVVDEVTWSVLIAHART